MQSQGKYKEAEAMYQRDLEVSEKRLGLEHSDMLTSISQLRLVLQNQGRHEEAEVMHQQLPKRREKVLRLKHPHMLIGIANLA
jgi:Tetratricopeptide repeat